MSKKQNVLDQLKTNALPYAGEKTCRVSTTCDEQLYGMFLKKAHAQGKTGATALRDAMIAYVAK